MRRFLSPDGEIVETKTIKEFADKHGLSYNCSRMLACGDLKTFRGWISLHPKAKKKRQRVMTKLINLSTYHEEVLGSTVRAFAHKHNLAEQEVYNLLNGKKIIYKNWVLRKTYDNISNFIADRNF